MRYPRIRCRGCLANTAARDYVMSCTCGNALVRKVADGLLNASQDTYDSFNWEHLARVAINIVDQHG